MHLVQTMASAANSPMPWHGLGARLAPRQPIEIWQQQAGMDWTIRSGDVRFVEDGPGTGAGLGTIHPFPDQKVLYRSDTKAPLSVVSRRFKVVQPREILEFYKDLTEVGGFELETAGVLKEGRKLWALAKTGQSTVLKGNDQVNAYLLLATACDGTLATTAQFTSVRVVCNNTLAIALRDSSGTVKVGHRSTFDAVAVKRQLGIAISNWDGFIARMKAMAACVINDRSEEMFLRRVLTYQAPSTNTEEQVVNERAMKMVHELYAGKGKGADLPSAHNTAWGLLNSVTEFIDHHRQSRSDDNRRDTAWFGSGAAIKQRAWDEALRLVS